MAWPDLLKADVTPLLLRLAFGGSMLALHGASKVMSFAERSETFADPLGVGPLISLCLAIFAEVVCSAALILGFATRLAAIPLLTTMLVALFIVHANDPWNKKELALLYAAAFVCLIATGSGRFSIDGWRRWRKLKA